MNDVRTLSTEELQQGLDRDSGLHVLNVQTDQFFAGELIPGSRRVPLDAIKPGGAGPGEGRTDCDVLRGSGVLTERRGRRQARGARLHERAYLP